MDTMFWILLALIVGVFAGFLWASILHDTRNQYFETAGVWLRQGKGYRLTLVEPEYKKPAPAKGGQVGDPPYPRPEPEPHLSGPRR